MTNTVVNNMPAHVNDVILWFMSLLTDELSNILSNYYIFNDLACCVTDGKRLGQVLKPFQKDPTCFCFFSEAP